MTIERKETDAPAGPNAVSNQWFRERRGRKINVFIIPSKVSDGRMIVISGILLQWDSYSLKMKGSEGNEIILIKAPGMMFEDYIESTQDKETEDEERSVAKTE